MEVKYLYLTHTHHLNFPDRKLLQYIEMASVQQVQSVAKRLEKMLETALNQLKIEQKVRKESENKLMNLELELVNKDHQIKSLEEQIFNVSNEKDAKISNLESTINFLQSVVVEKEKEVLELQKLRQSRVNDSDVGLENIVDKYEKTLSQLTKNSSDSIIKAEDSSVIDDAAEEKILEDNEYDTEEFVLDETMEELNGESPVMDYTQVEIHSPTTINSRAGQKNRCTICKLEFASKEDLIGHQNSEGHIVRFNCDQCNKNFKTKSSMQLHKLRSHSDLMPYKCGKCEKRFKDMGSCRRHEANDNVHKRLEKIKLNPNLLCNICGKEFDRNRRWCLDQHLLTHLASKKFSCDVCGKFYRQKAYLQTHMKQCSRSKAPVTDQEPNPASDNRWLYDDKVTNFGDNSFQCSICNVSFESMSGYQEHGKNVHNAISAQHFASIQDIISTST